MVIRRVHMHVLAPRILLVVQHYKGEAVHPLLSLRNCTMHTSPIDAVHILVGGSKNPLVGTVVVLGNFGKPVLVLRYSLIIPVFVVLDESFASGVEKYWIR